MERKPAPRFLADVGGVGKCADARGSSVQVALVDVSRALARLAAERSVAKCQNTRATALGAKVKEKAGIIGQQRQETAARMDAEPSESVRDRERHGGTDEKHRAGAVSQPPQTQVAAPSQAQLEQIRVARESAIARRSSLSVRFAESRTVLQQLLANANVLTGNTQKLEQLPFNVVTDDILATIHANRDVLVSTIREFATWSKGAQALHADIEGYNQATFPDLHIQPSFTEELLTGSTTCTAMAKRTQHDLLVAESWLAKFGSVRCVRDRGTTLMTVFGDVIRVRAKEARVVADRASHDCAVSQGSAISGVVKLLVAAYTARQDGQAATNRASYNCATSRSGEIAGAVNQCVVAYASRRETQAASVAQPARPVVETATSTVPREGTNTESTPGLGTRPPATPVRTGGTEAGSSDTTRPRDDSVERGQQRPSTTAPSPSPPVSSTTSTVSRYTPVAQTGPTLGVVAANGPERKDNRPPSVPVAEKQTNSDTTSESCSEARQQAISTRIPAIRMKAKSTGSYKAPEVCADDRRGSIHLRMGEIAENIATSATPAPLLQHQDLPRVAMRVKQTAGGKADTPMKPAVPTSIGNGKKTPAPSTASNPGFVKRVVNVISGMLGGQPLPDSDVTEDRCNEARAEVLAQRVEVIRRPADDEVNNNDVDGQHIHGGDEQETSASDDDEDRGAVNLPGLPDLPEDAGARRGSRARAQIVLPRLADVAAAYAIQPNDDVTDIIQELFKIELLRISINGARGRKDARCAIPYSGAHRATFDIVECMKGALAYVIFNAKGGRNLTAAASVLLVKSEGCVRHFGAIATALVREGGDAPRQAQLIQNDTAAISEALLRGYTGWVASVIATLRVVYPVAYSRSLVSIDRVYLPQKVETYRRALTKVATDATTGIVAGAERLRALSASADAVKQIADAKGGGVDASGNASRRAATADRLLTELAALDSATHATEQDVINIQADLMRRVHTDITRCKEYAGRAETEVNLQFDTIRRSITHSLKDLGLMKRAGGGNSHAVFAAGLHAWAGSLVANMFIQKGAVTKRIARAAEMHTDGGDVKLPLTCTIGTRAPGAVDVGRQEASDEEDASGEIKNGAGAERTSEEKKAGDAGAAGTGAGDARGRAARRAGGAEAMLLNIYPPDFSAKRARDEFKEHQSAYGDTTGWLARIGKLVASIEQLTGVQLQQDADRPTRSDAELHAELNRVMLGGEQVETEALVSFTSHMYDVEYLYRTAERLPSPVAPPSNILVVAGHGTVNVRRCTNGGFWCHYDIMSSDTFDGNFESPAVDRGLGYASMTVVRTDKDRSDVDYFIENVISKWETTEILRARLRAAADAMHRNAVKRWDSKVDAACAVVRTNLHPQYAAGIHSMGEFIKTIAERKVNGLERDRTAMSAARRAIDTSIQSIIRAIEVARVAARRRGTGATQMEGRAIKLLADWEELQSTPTYGTDEINAVYKELLDATTKDRAACVAFYSGVSRSISRIFDNALKYMTLRAPDTPFDPAHVQTHMYRIAREALTRAGCSIPLSDDRTRIDIVVAPLSLPTTCPIGTRTVQGHKGECITPLTFSVKAAKDEANRRLGTSNLGEVAKLSVADYRAKLNAISARLVAFTAARPDANRALDDVERLYGKWYPYRFDVFASAAVANLTVKLKELEAKESKWTVRGAMGPNEIRYNAAPGEVLPQMGPIRTWAVQKKLSIARAQRAIDAISRDAEQLLRVTSVATGTKTARLGRLVEMEKWCRRTAIKITKTRDALDKVIAYGVETIDLKNQLGRRIDAVNGFKRECADEILRAIERDGPGGGPGGGSGGGSGGGPGGKPGGLGGNLGTSEPRLPGGAGNGTGLPTLRTSVNEGKRNATPSVGGRTEIVDSTQQPRASAVAKSPDPSGEMRKVIEAGDDEVENNNNPNGANAPLRQSAPAGDTGSAGRGVGDSDTHAGDESAVDVADRDRTPRANGSIGTGDGDGDEGGGGDNVDSDHTPPGDATRNTGAWVGRRIDLDNASPWRIIETVRSLAPSNSNQAALDAYRTRVELAEQENRVPGPSDVVATDTDIDYGLPVLFKQTKHIGRRAYGHDQARTRSTLIESNLIELLRECDVRVVTMKHVAASVRATMTAGGGGPARRGPARGSRRHGLSTVGPSGRASFPVTAMTKLSVLQGSGQSMLESLDAAFLDTLNTIDSNEARGAPSRKTR